MGGKVLCVLFLAVCLTYISAVPITGKSSTPWVYMGCYQDQRPHDLTSAHKMKDNRMTHQKCYNYCSQYIMMYMAVQDEDECRCDNGYGLFGKLKDKACNEKCGGDSNEICGGDSVNSVYQIRDSLVDSVAPGLLPKNTGSKLVFSVLGDWGNAGRRQVAVAGALGKWSQDHHSSFVLAIGDNFYEDGVYSAYDPQFRTKWEKIYTHQALMKPWIVIEGNHDYHEGNAPHQVVHGTFDKRWVMPSLYYSFHQTVGSKSVHFIMLDTEPLHDGEDFHQLAWFEKEIKSSTDDWLIVVGHHPIFSSGGHGSAKSTMEMFRDVRGPLFTNKAALYICGHDHNLEHMREEADPTVDYVVSGSGSKYTADEYEMAKDNLKDRKVTQLFRKGQTGFVGIEMTEMAMTVSYIDESGNVIHSFTKVNPRESQLGANVG